MAIDFSTAPTEQGGELISEDTIAFATLTIRPKSIEFGKVLHSGKDKPENKYLDCELEIIRGPLTGRKVWHMLGVEGSEKWVNMSMAGIRHILEVGREAGAANPQGYVLGAKLPDGDERAWMELDGLTCAIKIGIEKGENGYKDKNRVKSFLSPNPDSSTSKDFAALVGGATSTAAPGKPAGTTAAWGGGATSTGVPGASKPTPSSAPAAASRPSWLGGAPPQAGSEKPKDVPF